MSLKLKTPQGVSQLENVPAYKRRNVRLAKTPSSSESNISRYTLSEDDDNNVEIKSNNSYLHDNVD
jgi:cell division protein FtsZ